MSDKGKVEAPKDAIAEKLDELADMSVYWKKNREKGRNPSAIRSAILQVVSEVEMMRSMEEAKKVAASS